MAEKQFKMTYALKDGVLTYIDDVERGKDCGCICPACEKPLVAKTKGEHRMPHFSHQKRQNNMVCYQTVLCYLAKEILLEERSLMPPESYITFYKPEEYRREKLQEQELMDIEDVELRDDSETGVPDIVVYIKGKPLIIVLYVDYGVYIEKSERLKKSEQAAMAIELLRYEESIAKEQLKEELLGGRRSNGRKDWIYNSRLEKIKKNIERNADRRILFSRKRQFGSRQLWACFGKGCPLSEEEALPLYDALYNAQYAVKDQYNYRYSFGCNKCKYCWGSDEERNTVLCAARCEIDSVETLLRLYYEQQRG